MRFSDQRIQGGGSRLQSEAGSGGGRLATRTGSDAAASVGDAPRTDAGQSANMHLRWSDSSHCVCRIFLEVHTELKRGDVVATCRSTQC